MHSIVARIQELSGQLTPTESRLVTALVEAPRIVALGTSADFAARAGAHEASTSRFARKLGFESYGAFRDQLRREFLDTTDPAERLLETLQASGGKLLGGLIAVETAALAAISDYLNEEMVIRAAELIDRPRLFLFAQGNATVLAEMFARRLRRMGGQPVMLTGSARDLAEQALAIGAGDTIVLFAFRRQPRSFAPLVGVAREVGAATLAISDTLGPALNPAPDLLLTAPRGGNEGGFQSLTVPMLICNALILALGVRHGGSALSVLSRLGTLIDRFD
ncbi:MurR/RpiR family transcriptional regulator [Fertoebacter nigrum]|uniref:MurR/RpiR family transcriptional regulator n=1 Tax=Fertoeibacter niger TaxID=2656921 RepID=A0A8X8H988_9RHOB|nr:MurR/RpiR family transcriptional regulator [Fertoeibacter niger]NUB45961.1 MurR/RpiR family transcriptional regulator [Fertoeibacter niger]